jgi:HlyD family secretion protein
VVVRLDQPDANLRPGLTCDAEITTAQLDGVLTVPLQSVVLRRIPGEAVDRTGVFVIEDARVRFVPVESGVIGGLDVQVTGVTEGASIVIGPFQVLRELADGAAVRVAAARR